VKYVRLITLVTLVLSTLGLPAAAAFAANAKPADQAFRLSVLLDEEDGLELRWSSPRATSFIATRFPRHSGKPLKVKTARGEIKDDPAFRPTGIYIARPQRTSMARICRRWAKY
jgi:hypothetical protein